MNSAERREARYQRRKAARMEKKAAALREYGDFETVFSFERLYESYRASVRGVGWKASTQRYKAASLANVTKTHEELIAGRYRSKGFYEFDIVERGNPSIFGASISPSASYNGAYAITASCRCSPGHSFTTTERACAAKGTISPYPG